MSPPKSPRNFQCYLKFLSSVLFIWQPQITFASMKFRLITQARKEMRWDDKKKERIRFPIFEKTSRTTEMRKLTEHLVSLCKTIWYSFPVTASLRVKRFLFLWKTKIYVFRQNGTSSGKMYVDPFPYLALLDFGENMYKILF